MQEIVSTSDAFIIKWLIGCVGFLVVLLNAILGYWFREVYKMVKSDHEILQEIKAEHKIFHKEETGMDGGH